MMRRPARDGFTLIELVITLVIIGLLATIAIPKLWQAISRSNESAIASDLRSLVNAQEIYFEKNMVYAADMADLPNMSLSSGVVITITHAVNTGWAATGTHPSVPDRSCGVRFGDAALATAPTALELGSVQCGAD